MPVLLYRALSITIAAGTLFVSAASAQSPKPTPAKSPAQQTATDRANRMAYETTMKCFIINGVATGERRQAGDTTKAASYEAAARRSFDLSTQLGAKLGYSGTRINQDFGLAETAELPKIKASDLTYYREVAATCKALGLLG